VAGGRTKTILVRIKLRRVELLMKLRLRPTDRVSLVMDHRSHRVTCHPTQVNTPRLNPSQRPVLEFICPGWNGWKAE